MSTKEKTKIVSVIGGTLWGNRGAEAMLVTTIGRIRERCPQAQFQIFSYYPIRDRRLCNDSTIQILNCRPLNLALKIFPLSVATWLLSGLGIRLSDRWAGPEVAALRRSDLVCDIGGITFCDSRLIFLLFNVLSLLPAQLLKVPVVKLSQAMGPFRNPINRFFGKRILSRCKKVFARGKTTAHHLADLELEDSQWQVASDTAFSYEPEFSLTAENRGRVIDLEKQLKDRQQESFCPVALIPSALLMQKSRTYLKKITELAHHLIESGFHVLLLPNATREGCPQKRNNDLVAIKEMVREIALQNPVSSDYMTTVDFDINTADLRRLIKQSHLVITSRFHGMIASLCEKVPVIVIGWSHKYQEVLEVFDCADDCVDHNADYEPLFQRIDQIVTNRESCSSSIEEKLKEVQASSLAQFDVIGEILNSTEDQQPEHASEPAAAVHSTNPDTPSTTPLGPS